MKGTEAFEKSIVTHLDGMAANDPVFAEKYKDEKKSIKQCIIYILNTVQKSGCNGFEDAEIFGMAVHYYDEENIDVGKPISMNVVVNQKIELTEEEKAEAMALARQEAIKKAAAEFKETVELTPEDEEAIAETAREKAFEKALADKAEKASKKPSKKKESNSTEVQSSLFG